MTSVSTWLLLIAGWAALALGAWLLVTGRGLSVKKKGRHCQRCWYDMAGIDTRKCPECGHTASGEKELGRRVHRRRWRIAGAAAMVGGWALLQTPAMMTHGWAAAVPGPVLARIAPLDLSQWAKNDRSVLAGQASGWGGWTTAASPSSPPSGLSVPLPTGRKPVANPGGTGTTTVSSNGGAPAPAIPAAPPATASLPDRVGDALFDEVWRRLVAGEIGERSGGAYLRRVTGVKGVPGEVLMPKIWAAGARPPKPRWLASKGVNGHTIEIEPLVAMAPEPATSLRVTIVGITSGRRYPMVWYDHPVDATRTRDNYMQRVTSDEIDRAVGRALAVRLVTNGNNAWLEAEDRDGSAGSAGLWAKLNFFICIRARVLLNGKELGHASFAVNPPFPAATGQIAALMAWEEGGEAAAMANAEGGSLQIELIGDPGAAAEQCMEDWTRSPAVAWSGTVTVQGRIERQKLRDGRPRP